MSLHTALFAAEAGRVSPLPLKHLGKIAGRRKTAEATDYRKRKICSGKQLLSLLDSPGNQIIDGRNTVFLCKSMNNMIFVGMSNQRQLIQSKVFPIVIIYIAANHGCKPGGSMAIVRQWDIKAGLPGQQKNEDIHVMLAHLFKAHGLCIDFCQ